eukprot:CAMPEP_0119014898 /NCGR_PEP_ID=MMETSP1176-20130426/10446_1 /TAXON_ID=265551 /ORGANISM="Synedropsis recta cf, Strain CCMP1620" /LENGTH=295 /DNA_ID=CAMNT_0006968145 /DNA_START=56 /DNA_END=940 /DNA_ORIENTATION=-
MSYTQSQTIGLLVAVALSSGLSVIGSSLIIWQASKKLDRPYHRLLIWISSLDIVTSLRYIVTFPMPRGKPGPACDADGFLYVISVAGPLYSASLAIYFLLAVRFSVSERKFQQRYEGPLVILPLLYVFVVAIFGLVTEVYSPNVSGGPGCFPNEYPANCVSLEDVDCLRGQDADKYILFTAIPIVLSWIVVLAANVVIYLSFRKLSKKSQRYVTMQDAADSDGRLKQIAIQSFLYVGCFLMTYILFAISWVLMIQGTHDLTDDTFYPLQVIQYIMMASQGTFNFCIYTYPRYRRW